MINRNAYGSICFMIDTEQAPITSDYPLNWVQRLRMPDVDTAQWRDAASSLRLASLFFSPRDIGKFVHWVSDREYAEGYTDSHRYIAVREGGMPLFGDLISTAAGRNITKRDSLKTKTYHGTEAGGVELIEPPRLLMPGESVTLVEDGIDTKRTLGFLASVLHDQFGVASLRAIVALTKQVPAAIEGIDEIIAAFETPINVWGEGYGFDNNGRNRHSKVIGMSMTQDPANYEIVAETLTTLGDVAVVTMDDIVRHNTNRLRA